MNILDFLSEKRREWHYYTNPVQASYNDAVTSLGKAEAALRALKGIIIVPDGKNNPHFTIGVDDTFKLDELTEKEYLQSLSQLTGLTVKNIVLGFQASAKPTTPNSRQKQETIKTNLAVANEALQVAHNATVNHKEIAKLLEDIKLDCAGKKPKPETTVINVPTSDRPKRQFAFRGSRETVDVSEQVERAWKESRGGSQGRS